MKKNTIRSLIAFTIYSSIAIAANFKTLHISDLSAQMKSGKPIVIYDVNVESTRKNAGIIPGSKLIENTDYDVSKTLPKDKKTPLVFYCANTMCTASHSAAERAMKSGYKDVSVMVDGIYGWKKAGEPTENFTAAAIETDPKTAARLAELKSAVIVDVREDEERHEVVPGALSMPMSQAQDTAKWNAFTATLPKDKTIVFHCARGVRAKSAAEKLSTSGYKTSYFKSPDQWKAAGLPVENGPAK